MKNTSETVIGQDAKPVQWLTVQSAPDRDHLAPHGWRCHAVHAEPEETWEDVRDRKSLCGVTPVHGWGSDLFIDRKCVRCLRAVGMACATCTGKGSTGKLKEGTWGACYDCDSTGEALR